VRTERKVLTGSFALVLDSVSSPHTRRAYERALTDFVRWFQDNGETGFTKAIVQAYRARCERLNLSSATINQRLAAIRKLATEASDNGLLRPELAAGIARVSRRPQRGVRMENWLTRSKPRFSRRQILRP
jgi:site-specific recombinase XerD